MMRIAIFVGIIAVALVVMKLMQTSSEDVEIQKKLAFFNTKFKIGGWCVTKHSRGLILNYEPLWDVVDIFEIDTLDYVKSYLCNIEQYLGDNEKILKDYQNARTEVNERPIHRGCCSRRYDYNSTSHPDYGEGAD